MLKGQSTRIRRREFLLRYLGNTMLGAGASLFGAAAAYEIYAKRAEASLGNLKRGAYVLPGVSQPAALSPAPAQAAGTVAAAASAQPHADASTGTPAPDSPASPEAVTVSKGAEPPTFLAAAPAVQPANITSGMLPVKLRIPSIGLIDAKIVEVGTKIENGQLVWATADHAVGHNVGTALPGQPGNMILAGHISSPVRGEGNVFHNLPSLADKIGSRVSVQTGDGSWFHYDIVGTNVVTPSDTWVLANTTTPVVTLLTCVPDGVYTHRFVALGKFAGKG
ncbi:MAG: sortase [Dehalococcoidia bacterium]